MDTFTASNGITVYVRDGGTVQFQHGTRDESCGILQVFPHSEWWQTLREFFRAEEDERLGRWRWPEDPDYVAYPRSAQIHAADGVLVLNERTTALRHYPQGDPGDDFGVFLPFDRVARAYVDAHPERKPWHDAGEGDVWALRLVNAETEVAYTVTRDTDGETDMGPRFFPLIARSTLFSLGLFPREFADGRRIWPEVTP